MVMKRLKFKFLKETVEGRKLVREFFSSKEMKKKLKQFEDKCKTNTKKYYRKYYADKKNDYKNKYVKVADR